MVIIPFLNQTLVIRRLTEYERNIISIVIIGGVIHDFYKIIIRGDIMKMVRCQHNLYCENILDTGGEYYARGYKKDYGLIEVMCKDGKFRWLNKDRFEGGSQNATYWRNLRLGYNNRGVSKLDSYPSGNYSKWYNQQNGVER